jgi:hypothetical protein
MAGLTLDAGALVAADRNDRRFWAYWAEAISRSVVPVIPAPALAQAWRSPRQARLAQVVNACVIDPMDEPMAKRAGQLCGSSRSSDIVDASVVVSAATRHDTILTTDRKDIRRLATGLGDVHVVAL